MKEESMFDWIEGLGLGVQEVVLGVLWDEGEMGMERRRGFGMGKGGKWRVERRESGDKEGLWER